MNYRAKTTLGIQAQKLKEQVGQGREGVAILIAMVLPKRGQAAAQTSSLHLA